MEATTEGNGTMPSTSQHTPEHACMEDVGHQLVNIEYIQQAIKQHIQRLENNKDGTTTIDLQSILPNLDELQSSLRKAFNAHARPLIRKLHIFHLPDELLIKIFEEVRIDYCHPNWGDDPASEPISITSLRLTCRRFCNTSSHLLLDSLTVALTYSSLEHLDEVARHPAISKGIRSLKINAALYSPVHPSCLQDFIVQVVGTLQGDNRANFEAMRNFLNYLEEPITSRGPRPSSSRIHGTLSAYLGELQARNEIFSSCLDYLRNGEFDEDQDEHMATLCHVFRQFSQLCDEQNALLEHDTFARRVAEAAARLPKSTTLHITDGNDYSFRSLSTAFLDPTYGSVRTNLLRPSHWAPELVSLLPHQPFKLLYQLPDAFLQAGVLLTKLSINLDSSTELDLGLSEAQADNLVSTTRNLEVLEIHCRLAPRELRSNTPSGAQVRLPRLVSLLLNSTNLKSVTLNVMGSSLSRDLGAGKLLSSLPWANLEGFDLRNAYIHGDELIEHLEKLSPGTHIYLSDIDLCTGLWVDLLDVIRAKADCHSSVTSPRGGEGGDLGHIFNDSWAWGPSPPSPADAYIRGEVSQNPMLSPEQSQPGPPWTNLAYYVDA